MVYSARQFVVCITMCHFVLVFFSPFNIVITSLGEERANLSAFRMFDRFVLVWICRFPLPLDIWEELRFVIMDFSLTFLTIFFVLIFLSGMASGKRVEAHIIVRRYSWPDGFGQGSNTVYNYSAKRFIKSRYGL